ncbi:pyocin activator protein [Ralstonia phage GP4]|uniref:Pyocin activator protein n=1 Tax=Ralstonia phage GP4 TaxID=2282904 RepID=A0A345GTY8_9CAUD|nr:excisionase [Ralstonia phage GP4]AXG67752.1 pyocin activator protein [Ralstonia phage GP4]
MRTAFLLMASYDGRTVIPLSIVCRDFFTHISEDKLQKKVLTGEIKLPIIRIEGSQKAARGVHIVDLAQYIDARREAAIKELRQVSG